MKTQTEKRKVAVVSGGLGGVGRAVCAKLAEDGFDVVALYRSTKPEEAELFLQTLAPGDHRALSCDISDDAEVSKVFAGLDAVYACVHAAVDPIIRKDLLTMEPAELQNQLGAALIGGFILFKHAVPRMQQAGEGRIVGILSQYLFTNVPHKKMGGYMLGKHALRGLMREYALEFGSGGISVAAVAPEFLDTNLSADLPVPVREFIKTRGVSGSMRTLDDVARAVSFLCSKEGSDMNGKVFSFDPSEIRTL